MGRDAGWDPPECGGTWGFFLRTLSPLLASPCRSACTHGTVLTGMRFSNSLLMSRVFTLVSLFKPQHPDSIDGLGKLWTAEAKTLFQKAMQLLLTCGDAWLAYIHPWQCLWSYFQRCPGSASWSSGPASACRLTGSQNLPSLTCLVHVHRHKTTRLS